MQTILLLLISNSFMTYAWYGHLKNPNLKLGQAVLISWGVAFFEYCFMVPANRIGYKTFNAYQLKIIQEVIETTRIQVTEEEAVIMWPKIKQFALTFNRQPDIASTDALERRMAEVLIYIKDQKRKKMYGN